MQIDKLLKQIKEVELNYPSLHFHNEKELLIIKGTFPLIDKKNNKEIDRYWIEIEVPTNYPIDIPNVRETGGRIPRIPDRHINPNGYACLFLEEEKNKFVKRNTTLLEFIEEHVFNFFCGQTYFELTEKESGKGEWIFGEWSHGTDGIFEFYSKNLNTNDINKIIEFVNYLSKDKIDFNYICFCGSNKKLSQCHKILFTRMKKDINPKVAKESLEALLKYKEK